VRGVRSQLVGERFGLLTVIAQSTAPPEADRRRTWWLCKCDCGNLVTRSSHELLRRGKRTLVSSCGCRQETGFAIGRALGVATQDRQNQRLDWLKKEQR